MTSSARDKCSLRCAVYTRKSSEEGLEQSFNSLDAQREACLAFIQSQRQEGWRPVSGHYDDGGYSGGNMDRPGLRQLLDDIVARKVDVVVVYKVDRLTRSLADFAKIIEIFDGHHVSFVSVTQQFNTTSSMGRLTLNVLLSFAQFEREVTGERIRDKIAASKRKGMWMGGRVPVGYELKDHRLIVHPLEAEQVREIFQLYLELGCVRKLEAHLRNKGITSKIRISRSGNRSGGSAYSRGALYKILQNRIYLGEIPHRGQSYPGEHQGIIEPQLWNQVRDRMHASMQGRHGRHTSSPSLLRGLLYDRDGHRYTPSHAVKKGMRYRYYVAQHRSQDFKPAAATPHRIPAHALEKAVLSEVRAFLETSNRVRDALGEPNDDLASIRKMIHAAQQTARELASKSTDEIREWLARTIREILIHPKSIEIHLRRQALRDSLLGLSSQRLTPETTPPPDEETIALSQPVSFRKCRGEMRLVLPPGSGSLESDKPIPSLVRAMARSHDWVRAIVAGEYRDQRAIAKSLGVSDRYVSRIIQSAFLAPEIVERIITGRQSSAMNLTNLFQHISLSWKEQSMQFRSQQIL